MLSKNTKTNKWYQILAPARFHYSAPEWQTFAMQPKASQIPLQSRTTLQQHKLAITAAGKKGVSVQKNMGITTLSLKKKNTHTHFGIYIFSSLTKTSSQEEMQQHSHSLFHADMQPLVRCATALSSVHEALYAHKSPRKKHLHSKLPCRTFRMNRAHLGATNTDELPSSAIKNTHS